MIKNLLITLSFTLIVTSCSTVNTSSKIEGLIIKRSSNSIEKTLSKTLSIFKAKGITVFKVVKHHEGAKRVGLNLSPTVTVIFGNPKLGTPLMQDQRSVAIDLPQKLLIYVENKKVFVAYNDPAYLKERHHLENSPQLKKISGALKMITFKIIK